MNTTGHTAVRLLLLLTASTFVGCGIAPREPCRRTADTIPPRPAHALSGTVFVETVRHLPPAEREDRILEAISRGNIPGFLRTFVPIHVSATIGGRIHHATYLVAPDYLSVGSDQDFVRMPMTPMTAQAIADRFDCVLPTPKMVDDIWRHATIKLPPSPISPKTTDITTVETFARHNTMIEARRGGRPLGRLIAGIKKDVVITPELDDRPGKVAIYGWHRLDGRPIQPLYLGHIARYVDYSHGIRLIRRNMTLDGRPADVRDILQDPDLHVLLAERPCLRIPTY